MKDEQRQEVYGLLAYILASAAGCVTEPQLYGPMRLADAAARLIRLLAAGELLRDRELEAIAERIERDKLLCMDDEPGFVRMLRDTSAAMAEIIRREGGG